VRHDRDPTIEEGQPGHLPLLFTIDDEGIDADVERLGQLYRAYGGVIFTHCRRRLASHMDAEDVVQETFIRALFHPPPAPEPLAWLRRVATNLCIDQIRRLSRRGDVVERMWGSTGSGSDERREWTPERRYAIEELLPLLTAREQSVVVLIVMEDLTHHEAALRLGISAGTSRVLQSRAMHKLRCATALELVPLNSQTRRASIAGSRFVAKP
jgi:RNA polymerase sigma factor (sigma-70 family)